MSYFKSIRRGDMTDKKCYTCIHWVSDDTRLGTCQHPKHLAGYRWLKVDIPDDGIIVEDDEGWGMFTGKLFGCVNWEG
jgi:hypothetical protein